MKIDRLAFDRGTVRSFDDFGRLKVSISNISKACVNPYYGEEIPDWQALGLEPRRIYQLLRDPAELEAGAASFNGVPLLEIHEPTAADAHPKELVVGAMGGDASFDFPYLRNSFVVWVRSAIDGIESREQCELSCSYAYNADMTPGVFEGQAYDGVMRNIRGNHVALVKVGRAGPDVLVGDSQPLELPMKKTSRKALVVMGALTAFLRPRLAQDAAIGSLDQALEGVDAKTFAAKKAAIADAITKQFKDKLAADASLDGLPALLEDCSTLANDEDDPPTPTKPAKDKAAKDKDPDDDDDDDDDDEVDENGNKKKKDKPAMDAAAVKLATDAAITKAVKESTARFQAIREAEKLVHPIVGEVVAMDSAEAVLKFALDSAEVDTKGVHPSAYKSLVQMVIKQRAAEVPLLAADSGSTSDFAKMFPNAKLPKVA